MVTGNGKTRLPIVLWAALTTSLLASAICTVFPSLDLHVSNVFYLGNRTFVGTTLAWVKALRVLFISFFWVCVAVSVMGLCMTWRKTLGTWLRLNFKQWRFLAVCLALGPGLVANLALKDHWGRARPKQVAEFGGNKSFTPALIPSNECSRNCSFVAGEPSSTFVPFYAAAFVIPQWSLTLVVVGTVCGLLSGFVRIAQGAHFFSDVIFAGILMMLIPMLAFRLLMTPPFRLTAKWRQTVPKNGSVGADRAAWKRQRDSIAAYLIAGGTVLFLASYVYRRFWHPYWTGSYAMQELWLSYIVSLVMVIAGWLLKVVEARPQPILPRDEVITGTAKRHW